MGIMRYDYKSGLVKKVVFVFFILLSRLAIVSAQQPVLYDSVAKIYSLLAPGVLIEQLRLNAIEYASIPDHQINFGLTGNEYHYLLVKFSASKRLGDYLISIDNTSIDTVVIYRVFPFAKSQLLYLGGALMEYNNNLYHWHTANVEIGEHPSYYLIASKASQRNINYRYDLLKRDTLQLKYNNYNKYVYAYCGIIGLILAIVLMAFILFRRIEFGMYAAYMLCFSGWVLAHYNRLFPVLYPKLPIINLVVKPIASLSACFFLIIVLRLVFAPQLLSGSQQVIKKIIRVTLFGLAMLTTSMLFFLLPHPNVAINNMLVVAWHIGLVISIGLVVYIPSRFLRSGNTARIFLFAISFVAVMAFIQILATLGFVNNFFINEHGMTLASLLEVTVMAFGLFYSLLEQMQGKEKHVLALEQEQTETLKKLVTVQDHERKRIAADLHDNIGPLMAALKINFSRILKVKDPDSLNGIVSKTELIIDDAIAEIRNVAHNLMPKGLAANGLIGTLKEYLDSIHQLYDKEVLFHSQVDAVLHIELQTNLYRIICELVLNAAKHSNAKQIMVSLTAGQQMVLVKIVDNGDGFNHVARDYNNSFGLKSAEGRVNYLKGIFILQSERGNGTSIDIQIPLQPN